MRRVRRKERGLKLRRVFVAFFPLMICAYLNSFCPAKRLSLRDLFPGFEP